MALHGICSRGRGQGGLHTSSCLWVRGTLASVRWVLGLPQKKDRGGWEPWEPGDVVLSHGAQACRAKSLERVQSSHGGGDAEADREKGQQSGGDSHGGAVRGVKGTVTARRQLLQREGWLQEGGQGRRARAGTRGRWRCGDAGGPRPH